MASKLSIRISPEELWHYRFGKKFLYCYSPSGEITKFEKKKILPLQKRLSKKDVWYKIYLDIIHKNQEKERIKNLPKSIKKLQNISKKGITIWSWYFPWECKCHPKLKGNLTLLGDGGLCSSFQFISDNEFKLIHGPGGFIKSHSRMWKGLKIGTILNYNQMEKLADKLV